MCICVAVGEGKAAVQGTAMASGAYCSVTRLMRHWADTGASGAPPIKIHGIIGVTLNAQTHRGT